MRMMLVAMVTMILSGCAPAPSCGAFESGPCSSDEDCDPGGPNTFLVCERVPRSGQSRQYQCVVGLGQNSGGTATDDCRNRGGVVIVSPHYGAPEFRVCLPPDDCAQSPTDAGHD